MSLLSNTVNVITDEYKERFLERFCSLTDSKTIKFKAKDLKHFLKRLDTLKEKVASEGLEESKLFEILSYDPDDELELFEEA